MTSEATFGDHLISTEDLSRALGREDVVVLDCTTRILPVDGGGYTTEAQRATFEVGHVPGAQFVDLQHDLSDPESRWRFMLPSPERFEAAMRRFGVGETSRVVLYSTGDPWWATRVWWMLRVFGFDRAAVLDGGFTAWRAEGRPIETGPGRPRAAGDLRARFRPEAVAGRDDVLAFVAAGDRSRLINARTRSTFLGRDGNVYGRPGRIAASSNVPANDLWDPETGRLRPIETLRARFAETPFDRPVIVYCGHGIAASADAFVLDLLGHDGVRLYDASLSEWAAADDLPMETGEIPAKGDAR